jgi:non-ribosomal peptide synthetase component F
MHHIVSDAVSHVILIRDFLVFYGGGTLPPLRIQYKDYSRWQDDLYHSEELRKQEIFWLGEFSGDIPVLNMPLDYSRPPVQSFEGERITFQLEKPLTARLKRLTEVAGTTMFMLLMASYNVLLFKYTGQQTVVVGAPTAGRSRADLDHIIGMFANTLAIQNILKPQQTFREFLAEVKNKLLKVFENQDYPFEMLVERLNHEREPGRNPLFDTMFVMQNVELARVGTDLKDLRVTPYEFQTHDSVFDLTLQGMEGNDYILFYLDYCIKLFKRETMERVIADFKKILQKVAENPEVKISQIDTLSPDEKNKILFEFSTLKEGETYDFE